MGKRRAIPKMPGNYQNCPGNNYNLIQNWEKHNFTESLKRKTKLSTICDMNGFFTAQKDLKFVNIFFYILFL